MDVSGWKGSPGDVGRWESKTLICLSWGRRAIIGYEDVLTLSLLGSPGISPHARIWTLDPIDQDWCIEHGIWVHRACRIIRSWSNEHMGLRQQDKGDNSLGWHSGSVPKLDYWPMAISFLGGFLCSAVVKIVNNPRGPHNTIKSALRTPVCGYSSLPLPSRAEL